MEIAQPCSHQASPVSLVQEANKERPGEFNLCFPEQPGIPTCAAEIIASHICSHEGPHSNPF